MTDPTVAPPSVGAAALTSYLSGQQNGQAKGEEWALLDSLAADDLRDLAKDAIRLLAGSLTLLTGASLALDPMTGRARRLQTHDVVWPMVDRFLTDLGERLGLQS